ncbi:glucose-1-phosphate adenylyltransferase [Verrucomicrobia bacterium LW23]|nr:glucose-1-phosphate adenylyltransferase [Verrucomicrobia bacterium LW23]
MEITPKSSSFSPRDVVSVIMGGGAGTRLFPLTKDRAKPAVPLAGKYRLVDIPISNCINSDLKRIFLLTQYLSSSLHRHIQQSYRFDDYSGGFVEIMAAQQNPSTSGWYQGTADAVRQNMQHFNNHAHEYVLILSGDQLYRMNFRRLIEQHIKTGADVTVATIPVGPAEATGFGIMQTDADYRIERFVEKPKDPAVLETLRLDDAARAQLKIEGSEPRYLASMGIYVFNRRILEESLANEKHDFGKDIIPELIQSHRVYSYTYQGYWEDIGTIKAFFEANIDLTEPVPKFNFYDFTSPIYTRARYLPASKIVRGLTERAAIADGCIIVDARIEHSVIGIRSRIDSNSTIRNCIIMGHDFYESDAQLAAAEAQGLPRMGIGRNCMIQNCIIDKNARIGNEVTISPEGKPSHVDGDCYYIRDGIVVIPKGAVVPNGTTI